MGRTKIDFMSKIDMKAFEQDLALSYPELMAKYNLSWNHVVQALNHICKKYRRVDMVKPKGSTKICQNLKEFMPDLELMHREGMISDYRMNQYRAQA